MNTRTLRKLFFVLALVMTCTTANAQHINVLFLGNSYTAVNDLPGTINALLEGSEKTMAYASNTPGGCCFFQHATASASLNLIRRGDWDYVVLQEQSQMPSIDYYRYGCMYPAAEQLRDSIMKYNPCAEVVFYMTWGRRDGGQQCEDYGEGIYCSADFRDFDHMQDTMTRAYREIAEILNCCVSPVGEAWRYSRQISDIELFSGDGSHPSMQGTYLTACTFFTTFWKENPMGLPHPESISESEASILQKAALHTMIGAPSHWNFQPDLHANFEHQTDDQITYHFINTTDYPRPMTFQWDFGDGNTSEEENPIHEYAESGLYTVKLLVESCQKTDIMVQEVAVVIPDGIWENSSAFSLFPNPALGQITVSGHGWLSVSNMLGQQVIHQYIDGKISLNLKSGIYAVEFSDGSTNYRKKIVVH